MLKLFYSNLYQYIYKLKGNDKDMDLNNYKTDFILLFVNFKKLI